MRRPDDLDVVRDSYDRVADNYVHMVQSTGFGDVRTQPWLKAAVDIFAAAVGGKGPVLDVGCGPGTVTAYLHEQGVDAAGVDLSPRMIEHARRLYPECRFTVGSATELDLAAGSLAGILGWWSLFNLPRELLPDVLATMSAALMPGGQLLLATHVGDRDVARTTGYGGVPVSWTTYQWMPDELISLVEAAGLRLLADLRLPAAGPSGPGVVLTAQRDEVALR
ncbi:MAG: class I SAM-dependent methyltransferase [Propionibacteriaceae bacterium]